MHNQRYIVVITGPTGVGKSALADQLALESQIPIEIINADMGQMYTPLSIGTAKPDLGAAPVPHHLFNILDEPSYYTVVQYRKAVQQLIEEIWQRNALPVIVGGSSFYIQSLFFPPLQEEGIPLCQAQEYPQESLWDVVYAIDPERAAAINKNDTYRLQRALAIWHTTGKKPSALKPIYNPMAPFIFIYVTRDRAELYARINERVQEMLMHGWLQEVQPLLGTAWEAFIHEKKIIGYPDIIDYYRSEQQDRDVLCDAIAQKTRHYAKRQEIFWRRLERMLHEELHKESHSASQLLSVNLTTTELDLYIKQLLDTINSIEK